MVREEGVPAVRQCCGVRVPGNLGVQAIWESRQSGSPGNLGVQAICRLPKAIYELLTFPWTSTSCECHVNCVSGIFRPALSL